MQFSVAQEKERARHWLPLTMSRASQENFCISLSLRVLCVCGLHAWRFIGKKTFAKNKMNTQQHNSSVAFFLATVCGSFRTGLFFL
jgi:hypothetical protein